MLAGDEDEPTDYATIAGGANNQVGWVDGFPQDRTFATVGGGEANSAISGHATVAGGGENRAGGGC